MISETDRGKSTHLNDLVQRLMERKQADQRQKALQKRRRKRENQRKKRLQKRKAKSWHTVEKARVGIMDLWWFLPCCFMRVMVKSNARGIYKYCIDYIIYIYNINIDHCLTGLQSGGSRPFLGSPENFWRVCPKWICKKIKIWKI